MSASLGQQHQSMMFIGYISIRLKIKFSCAVWLEAAFVEWHGRESVIAPITTITGGRRISIQLMRCLVDIALEMTETTIQENTVSQIVDAVSSCSLSMWPGCGWSMIREHSLESQQ